MPRTVENWLSIILKGRGDIAIARQLLGDMTHYHHGGAHEQTDVEQVLNFITAIRIRALKP